MDNKKEKQLIYVKDLLFRALYHWKLILVVALAFALLLGAFSVLTNKQDVSVGGLNMTPQTQAKVENLEFRLEKYNSLIDNLKNYIENSSAMQLNPYAVYTCGFHLCPTPLYETEITEATPIEQDTAMLLRAYRSMATSTEVIDAVAQQLGLDSQDLRNLITFDTSTEGALGIRIYGQTQEEAQVIADALVDISTAYHTQINQELHAHDLKILPFHFGPMYDSALVDTQNSAYQKLTNYENERLNIKNELDRYKPTQLTAESSNPLLYAVVGAIFGAFVVVCFVWLIHLGSDKIYSARVLVNRTGIRVLGCVDSGKKRFFVDRWLRKLEGRNTDGRTDALAINIRNRCQDAKSLLIMGNFSEKALSQLTGALEQAGIRCHVCNDPTLKKDALEALPSCDAVVIAETCGTSRYTQVEWAMETIDDHCKKLIGCVLIDG